MSNETPGVGASPKAFKILVALTVAGLAVCVVAMLVVLLAGSNRNDVVDDAAAARAAALAELRVPEFNLTDQDGEPIDTSVLDGHITVLDFIFTNCPTACPGMTAAMARVQRETQGTGLRLLSISVDGEHDTPERLRSYAGMFKADFDRWTLATGDPDVVWPLVQDGLNFALDRDTSLMVTRHDGTQTPLIVHPTKLILVGPDRRIIDLFSYDDPAAVDALIERAKAETAKLD